MSKVLREEKVFYFEIISAVELFGLDKRHCAVLT